MSKTECSICLEKIDKSDQQALECKHMFHSSCIMQWALETSCKTGMVEFQRPIKNRRIHLFKQGENIFTCPCCRIEYTHDVVSHGIKRVLAKAHVANKGKYLVHYITNAFETMAYVPLSEITNDGNINSNWATILVLLKPAWERGDTDIYAMKRLYPEPEFVLTNHSHKIPPLNKLTGAQKKEIKDGQLMIFRMVDVDELDELLNNK